MPPTLPHGHVTGKITKTVLAYSESVVGVARTNALAERVAKQSNVDVAILREAEARFHMDVAEALYPLVVEELRDLQAIEKAGIFSANMNAVGIFVFGMVKLMGGIKFVYEKVADINPRFANTGLLKCTKVTSTSACLEFEMYKDLRCTKLGCDYRKGVFASVPLTFGKTKPAALKHPMCQAQGAAREVYELSWD